MAELKCALEIYHTPKSDILMSKPCSHVLVQLLNWESYGTLGSMIFQEENGKPKHETRWPTSRKECEGTEVGDQNFKKVEKHCYRSHISKVK